MYLSPVYTAAPAVADERVGAAFAALDSLGIPYIRFEHDATATMEDCAAVGKALEGTICKNLFLCNRQQTAFYLYVTLPDKPFRTADTSKLLHSSRLSFAPSECLPTMLGLESGSLSPLGLWFDEEKRIQLVFDHDVKREGRIAFHPCDNTATVVFAQEVFWTQVVPTLGHEPIWL